MLRGTLSALKAVELDPSTRKRTGREVQLKASARQAAIDELLGVLGLTRDQARVDPTRTMVDVGGQLWTIVATRATQDEVSSSLRRAGAKHRRVR